MNVDPTSEVPVTRLVCPALFVVLAFNFWLLFQIHAVWIASSNYRKHDRELVLQLNQANVSVESAKTMQSLLERLANEMLFLAESDADLQRLVQKYQITRKASPEQPAPSR